ncbi:UNVERIFIED_CONTAM: hypothetical protein PYX00_000877 [Menopon gallinae]|uniref:Uncharacterized protein n=1 Tax=Menopon gallinae TaxID=328185 RepID=A0AAW2IA88_9NEOP
MKKHTNDCLVKTNENRSNAAGKPLTRKKIAAFEIIQEFYRCLFVNNERSSCPCNLHCPVKIFTRTEGNVN